MTPDRDKYYIFVFILQGLSLSNDLSGPQKSELKAYMALTVNRLRLAEVSVKIHIVFSLEQGL